MTRVGDMFTLLIGFLLIAAAEGQAQVDDELPDAPAGEVASENGEENGGASEEELLEENEDDGLDADTVWESYGETTQEGIAQDVTGGVRVEDIIEPPSDYTYAAFGKPDPFVPPMVTEKESGPSSVEIPIVSPLQKFPLDLLKITGIWRNSEGGRKALVMTPGNQGITVKEDDPIGNRGGRILSIGPKMMTVREFSLAPDGTRLFEDRDLFLGGKDDDVGGAILFEPGNLPKVVEPDQADRRAVNSLPMESTGESTGESVGGSATESVRLPGQPPSVGNAYDTASPAGTSGGRASMAPGKNTMPTEVEEFSKDFYKADQELQKQAEKISKRVDDLEQDRLQRENPLPGLESPAPATPGRVFNRQEGPGFLSRSPSAPVIFGDDF